MLGGFADDSARMREFRHQIRVRYAETDAQQVAHHSAYVVWLEEARIEALRSMGRCYRTLESTGLLMPVIEVSVRYRRSLVFDDRVDLITTIHPVGRARLRFETLLQSGGEDKAEATVTVAVVDAQGRPQRVPEDLLALLTEA